MLAVHRHGPDEGVPLVLLHAFPLDSRMYARAVPELEGLPVLTVDSPGFGDSPAPEEVAEALGWTGGPSLELTARAVLASLDAQGVDRFVVAGTSIGGYVSMRLAALVRERLVGIGLIDTKAAPDDEAVRERREKLATAAEGPAGSEAVAPTLGALLGATTVAQDPALVDAVADWATQASPAGIAHSSRAMAARPDSVADLEVLAAHGVAARVLRGEEDTLASEDDALVMAEALGTEAMVVAGVGHLAPLEAPEQVGRALRDLHERALGTTAGKGAR